MGQRVCHRADESGTVCTVRVEGESAATPCHAHLSLILGRVDHGSRTLRLLDGPVPLGPGDGFVIPPDTPHAWDAATDGRHRVLALAPPLVQAPAWTAGRLRAPAWDQAFDALFTAVETGAPVPPALVEAILGETSRHAPTTMTARVTPGTMRMARRKVVEHLDETLSLNDLARRVGVSPFHLHRLYRRTWGLTPAEHRLEARLRQARGLILQGATLADAAAATGFADQSHFHRAFRRLMGVAPGLWARQMRVTRRPMR